MYRIEINLLINFLIFPVVLPNNSSQPDIRWLEDKLLEYTIIPEILQCFPRYEAKVRFSSRAEVKGGNPIPLKDMNKAPEVHWEHNSSRFYSLIITDMDDKVNNDKLIQEYQLWFVCNIPGDEVSKGYEHLEYIPPKVTSDPHRITITVVEQSLVYKNASVTKLINLQRHFFAAMEVVYEYKGIIWAANCYNATL